MRPLIAFLAMPVSFISLVVLWSCLAAIVLLLAIVRSVAGLHEDDNIHIAPGEEQLIPKQVAFYGLLNRIDRWGKALTILTVAGGLALAAVYLYRTLPQG